MGATTTPPLGAEAARAMSRRRAGLWPFVALILACAVAVGWALRQGATSGSDLTAAEDASLSTLHAVHAAELTFHQSEGRYAWVDELHAAGLLPGYTVGDPDGMPHVLEGGYRVDVLLPHAQLGPEVVSVAPRGEGRPMTDAALAAKHFAVVARPVEPGVSGWRSWYMDETKALYVHEGVVDDDAALRNDLPRSLVTRPDMLHTGRPMIWRLLESLQGDE